MGKLLGEFDKLVDNQDPMILKPTVLNNGNVCDGDWHTPVSKTTGFSLHIVQQEYDGALLEVNGYEDTGGYVYLDTDDIDALIDVLKKIRVRTYRAQAAQAARNAAREEGNSK